MEDFNFKDWLKILGIMYLVIAVAAVRYLPRSPSTCSWRMWRRWSVRSSSGSSTLGIEVHKSVPDAASKEWQMAESLMHDGKTLAYRYALMVCINPSDDIKVDSTLKALAKDPTVSARIIERLKV